MIDEILQKLNLKWDDLTPVEKETLNVWVDTIQKGAISVEKIREYIRAMKDAVEQELTKADVGTKQDLFLKARLRNYMLLDGFMTSPEKAKQQLENTLSSLVGKKT